MTGEAAEERVNPHGGENAGRRKDAEDATRIVTIAICEAVRRADGDWEITREEITLRAPQGQALLDRAWRSAREIIAENWAAVEEVAARLLERGRLTGEEVAAIDARRRPG